MHDLIWTGDNIGLDVSFWVVVEDRTEDGRRVSGLCLSPKFATQEQCREALAGIENKHPNAYIGRRTVFFREGDPFDVATRKALLDEIRCGESSHA